VVHRCGCTSSPAALRVAIACNARHRRWQPMIDHEFAIEKFMLAELEVEGAEL
jgi:hypothetical protein